MSRPLVIGLGHQDRGDDGFGLAFLERLPVGIGRCHPADPAALVAAFVGRPIVAVVDVLADGATPGTWHRLDLTRERLPAEPRVSGDGHGLALALAVARSLDTLPPGLVLHGASGRDFGVGAPMQPAVRLAIDLVAASSARSGATRHPCVAERRRRC